MNRATRTLIIATASLLCPLLFATAQAAEPATHDHEHSSAAAPAPGANAATAMQHMDGGHAHRGMLQDAMHQHMEMMTMMMQMMMDREQMRGDMMPGTPGAAPDHSRAAAPQTDSPKP